MFAKVWVEEATRKIRFKPDRAAVGRELDGHIRDIRDKYEAQGLSPYDAEMKATEDMGDPAAIAEDLGRIHRPYWGWLWRLSQWVLGILLVWAVFAGIGYVRDYLAYPPTEIELPQLPEAVESNGAWTRRLLEHWDIGGSVNLGGYRFTVPLAYLQEITYEGSEDYTPLKYELTVCLRASTWRFWEPIDGGQYMILSHEAVDSAGTRYGRWEPGLFSEETHRSYFCNTYSDGPFAVWYEIELDIPGGEMPDWVDIPVGYGEECLRVNFAEEVVTP